MTAINADQIATLSPPSYPNKGTAASGSSVGTLPGTFLRANSYSVATLPYNGAVIAVSSQDPNLLATTPSNDLNILSQREADRVYLISTTIAANSSTAVLCGKVLAPIQETYCTALTFSDSDYVDIVVPSYVWANTNYTNLFGLDGPLKGLHCVVDSRPQQNVWRIFNLNGTLSLPVGEEFRFVAYGVSGAYAPSVNGLTPLPYITYNNIPIPAIHPIVVSNTAEGYNGLPTLYVLAEAPIEGAYQLFFYSISNGQTFGWKQLTFVGENRNARASVGTDGTLHVVFESSRNGPPQLYYGVVGPSSRGTANEVFISSLDKASAYNQSNGLLSFGPTIALDLRPFNEYGPVAHDEMWFIGDSSPVTIVVDDATVTTGGNPSEARFGAYASLQTDENENYLDGTFDQFSYQLSFNLKMTTTNLSQSISDAEIQNQFEAFKAQFAENIDPYININTYEYQNNVFTIGEPQYIYENLIPLAGSYKMPSVALNHNADSSGRLRHFMLGIVPEKIRFSATNVQPSSGVPTVQQEFYTGKGKLCVLFETSANADSQQYARQKFHAVRTFGQVIDWTQNNNFKVAVHYVRLNAEQAAFRESIDLFSQDWSYSGNILVTVNDNIQGAFNFVPDFSDNYYSFEIGLGCPDVGEYRTTLPLPFSASVFADIDVTMDYSAVAVGPHSIQPTNRYLLAPLDRDTTRMLVNYPNEAESPLDAAQAVNMTAQTYNLSIGMTRSACLLNQIPLTFSSKNVNPSLIIDVCGNLHVAYQSYRDGNWEIYYTGATGQSPFRYDTRITKDGHNSLMPDIGVDSAGRRLIVWHDDRNGPYQIYGARSLTTVDCLNCDVSLQDIEYITDMELAGIRDDIEYAYEPYWGGICQVPFVYTNNTDSPQFVQFRLSFFLDEAATEFYRSADSRLDITNWLVNDQQLPYDGAYVDAGDSINLTYVVSDQDDLQGTVYYARIEVDNGETITELPNSTIFFCPVKQSAKCTIPCAYSNGSGQSENVHFVVTVFADEGMTQPVLSVDSSESQVSWVSGTQAFPSEGLTVANGQMVSAFYRASFLPVKMYDQIGGTSSLLCGVRYYASIYAKIASSTTLIDLFALECDCDEVAPDLSSDTQSPQWICSGQGQDDRRITATNANALFPRTAGSSDGTLYIVWEDQRYSDPSSSPQLFPDIFWSIWDSADDKFYSSAQGSYDRRLTAGGSIRYLKPQVVICPLQNPTFFYQTHINVLQQSATLYQVASSSITSQTTGDTTGVFNQMSLSDVGCVAIDVLAKYIVRNYHEDAITPISLVSDCFVEFDIQGPPGTYAIRLQNESDTSFSDWLQILPELPNYPTRTDVTERNELTAFYISKDRFVVPWVLSAGSGRKTVSVQILTPQGITPTITRDVLASYDDFRYTVDFFSDVGLSVALPQYNGFPIVSTFALSNGNTISQTDVSSIADDVVDVSQIYIRIKFTDPAKLARNKQLSAIAKYAHLGNVTFSVIQQGIGTQVDLPLTETSEGSGIYTGSFAITGSDGYRTKDGLGVIVVNVPTPCNQPTPITVQDCDNPTAFTPEDYRQQQSAETANRHLSLQEFRDKYDRELLCSFGPAATVVLQQPLINVDDISNSPPFTGPVSCSGNDWIADQDYEINYLKNGDGLTTYYRSSQQYTLDWSDSRITKLVIGGTSDVEGILFMVPSSVNLSVTASNTGVLYNFSGGVITLGATAGYYEYGPTPSTNGTAAKIFSISSGNAITIPAGTGTSGNLSLFTSAYTPIQMVAGVNTSITTAQLQSLGFIQNGILRFTFVLVNCGPGHACVSDVSCSANCIAVPDAPAGLSTPAISNYAINASWTAVDGADGYSVRMSTDGVTFNEIAITTATTYLISGGLLSSTTYCFEILAFNACGYSAPSPTSCATTGCISPTPVTGFAGVVVSDTQINLSWNLDQNASNWLVQRKLQSDTNFTTIATLSASSNSYPDTSVVQSTCYYYQIAAVNDCGTTNSSVLPLCATCTVPSNVTGVTVSAVTATENQISWTAATFATSYLVTRSGNNGAFTQIATVTGLSTTDSSLQDGVSYCYQVQARNNCGTSAVSSPVCESVLNCGTPQTTFSWSRTQMAEPSMAKSPYTTAFGAPCDTVWMRVSPSGQIDLSDHRITQITFGPTAELDDILVLVQNTDTPTESWTGTLGDPNGPTTFGFPENAIFFYNNYGFYVNPGNAQHTASNEKILNVGTLTCTIPAGLGEGVTGDVSYSAAQLASCGLYFVNFSDGISRDVLQSRGFIDENGQFKFKFAHIICGSGFVRNLSLTCNTGSSSSSGTSSSSSSGGCPISAPTNLTATATDLSIAINWQSTNASPTQYEVWRQVDGGDYENFTLTNNDTTTFTDTVIDGHTYCYKVRALRCQTVYSGFTSIVCAEGGCPAVCDGCCDIYVINVTGTTIYDGTYTFTRNGCYWKDNTEFNVLRKNNGNWELTIGGAECLISWITPCTGCPPVAGYVVSTNTCSGGATSSSSSGASSSTSSSSSPPSSSSSAPSSSSSSAPSSSSSAPSSSSSSAPSSSSSAAPSSSSSSPSSSSSAAPSSSSSGAPSSSSSGVCTIGIFNTGQVGSMSSGCNTDNYWTVTTPTGGAASAAKICSSLYYGWETDQPTYKWISYVCDVNTITNTTETTITFATIVTIGSLAGFGGHVTLDFSLAADDQVTDMRVNGVSTGYVGPFDSPSFATGSITDANGLVTGTNTIEIDVMNIALSTTPNPTGLMLEWTAVYCGTVAPSSSSSGTSSSSSGGSSSSSSSTLSCPTDFSHCCQTYDITISNSGMYNGTYTLTYANNGVTGYRWRYTNGTIAAELYCQTGAFGVDGGDGYEGNEEVGGYGNANGWIIVIGDDDGQGDPDINSAVLIFTAQLYAYSCPPATSDSWSVMYDGSNTAPTESVLAIADGCISTSSSSSGCAEFCFQMGSSGTWTAPCTGTIYMLVNDTYYPDNSGSLNVIWNGIGYTVEGTDSIGVPVQVDAGATYGWTASGIWQNEANQTNVFYRGGPDGWANSAGGCTGCPCPAANYASLIAIFIPGTPQTCPSISMSDSVCIHVQNSSLCLQNQTVPATGSSNVLSSGYEGYVGTATLTNLSTVSLGIICIAGNWQAITNASCGSGDNITSSTNYQGPFGGYTIGDYLQPDYVGEGSATLIVTTSCCPTDITIWNTGQDIITGGSCDQDAIWTYNGNPAVAPATPYSSYFANGSNYRWITAVCDFTSQNGGTANNIYATKITIPMGTDLTTFSLSAQIGVDNTLQDISVNGTPIDASNINSQGFSAFNGSFTIPSSANWQIGVNNVAFTVYDDGTKCGLAVRWNCSAAGISSSSSGSSSSSSGCCEIYTVAVGDDSNYPDVYPLSQTATNTWTYAGSDQDIQLTGSPSSGWTLTFQGGTSSSSSGTAGLCLYTFHCTYDCTSESFGSIIISPPECSVGNEILDAWYVESSDSTSCVYAYNQTGMACTSDPSECGFVTTPDAPTDTTNCGCASNNTTVIFTASAQTCPPTGTYGSNGWSLSQDDGNEPALTITSCNQPCGPCDSEHNDPLGIGDSTTTSRCSIYGSVCIDIGTGSSGTFTDSQGFVYHWEDTGEVAPDSMNGGNRSQLDTIAPNGVCVSGSNYITVTRIS